MGRPFEQYDFSQRKKKSESIVAIVDRILHARVLGVLKDHDSIPNGILVSSDRQIDGYLMHFSMEEFRILCERFMEDKVLFTSDSIDLETGKVTAVRKGK